MYIHIHSISVYSKRTSSVPGTWASSTSRPRSQTRLQKPCVYNYAKLYYIYIYIYIYIVIAAMHPGRILRTFSHLKVIRISVAEPYDVGIDETGNHIIAMYHIIATSRPRSQRCAYFIIISCRYYYQSPTSLLSVAYVLIISRLRPYYQSAHTSLLSVVYVPTQELAMRTLTACRKAVTY